MNTKQKGYTLTELIFFIAFFAVIAIGGFIVYAVVHFISKFW